MFNLKKQHTVLALLLAFALCLQFAVPVLPVAAEEATYTSGTCGTGPDGAVVSWELMDDVLVISGKGGITYDPFTAEQREYLIPRVKYLVIHNGIDTIGDNAFKGFENLSSVSLSADPGGLGGSPLSPWGVVKGGPAGSGPPFVLSQ